MPLIQAPGAKLNVQQMGTSGSPVVMVHGMMLGTISTWWFGAGPALASSHRVFLYDLRGHGLSERVGTGFSLHSMTRDLDAVVEHAGGGPVSLVGHSYGGAIVLRYAINHPEKVSRIALVEAPIPAVSMDSESVLWAQTVQTIAASRRGEDLIRELTDDDRKQLFGGLPAVVRDALLKNGKRPNKLLRQILGLISDTTMLDDLAQERDFSEAEMASVRCPVLLVYGDRSGITPSEDSLILRAFPDVRLRVFGGGHSLPQDATREVVDAIREFLNE